jgi:hypothetical protein
MTWDELLKVYDRAKLAVAGELGDSRRADTPSRSTVHESVALDIPGSDRGASRARSDAGRYRTDAGRPTALFARGAEDVGAHVCLGAIEERSGNWTLQTASADSEIHSSLTQLRARSRQLVRDSAYAKRARAVVVNNVIGAGMGLQAKVNNSRKLMHSAANDGIEAAFEKWSRAEFCHTGGVLNFADIEQVSMGEIFEAGEIFVRMHFSKFGGSEIPFALEVIESERVPHDTAAARGRREQDANGRRARRILPARGLLDPRSASRRQLLSDAGADERRSTDTGRRDHSPSHR